MLRTVTEMVNGREAVMQISGVPGQNVIPIRHEDTKDLAVGRYSADIQLMTADGLRTWTAFSVSAEDQVHKNSAGYARIGEKIAGAIIREFGN